MASELQVTTIRGVPTGANANQINIPAGQTLHAPGHVLQVVQATKTKQTLKHRKRAFMKISVHRSKDHIQTGSILTRI